MSVSRRDFLRYCTVSAGVLGLASSDIFRLGQVLAGPACPKVIWLQGAGCTGCSVSFLNRISDEDPQTVADVLVDWINLAYHPNLMDSAGETAAAQIEKAYNQKNYILAVEGGVPTGFGGAACWAYTRHGEDVTFEDAVRNLASRAWAIVSVGTCAAWGGIPAAGTNPTGVVGVGEFTGKTAVNVAGCPPHPDWIVWAIVQLVLGESIALDDQGRPSEIFQRRVHQECSLRNAPRASTFGIPGQCLRDLGCRGSATESPCPVDRWNNGVNWCVEAGSQCLGCTDSGFPGALSLYEPIGSPTLSEQTVPEVRSRSVEEEESLEMFRTRVSRLRRRLSAARPGR